MVTRAQSFQQLADEAGTDVATLVDDLVRDGFDGTGLVVSDVQYRGSATAAFVVDGLTISEVESGAVVVSLGDGILLTSGGLPPTSNTDTGFSVVNDTPGDPQLDAVAQAAFDGSGTTNDASIISFSVLVDDATIDGFSLDIVFGSDEYPEFSNSSFVDVAAVIVNGENEALFDNDANLPLSVIDANLVNGNFVNNDVNGGLFEEDDIPTLEGEGLPLLAVLEDDEVDEEEPIDGGGDGPDIGEAVAHDIEYDGFSNVLTVRAPLQQGLNTVLIGVADTGDFILDSGLFVSNLQILTGGGTGGGTLRVVDGTAGADTLEAGLGAEEINTQGGNDTVTGTPEELDGDIITGFDVGDELVIEGIELTEDAVSVSLGSLVIRLDLDDDGAPDATVTLAGEFDSTEIGLRTEDGNTILSLPEDDDEGDGGDGGDGGDDGGDGGDGTTIFSDLFNGGAEDDVVASLGDERSILRGGGGDDFITGGDGRNFLRGGSGDDTITGGDGPRENLNGGSGNDDLFGNGGSDRIAGGAGDDLAVGGAGDDRVYGGAGSDTIVGGDGDDRLAAGGGSQRTGDGAADEFVFDADDGTDVVFGFEAGSDSVTLLDPATLFELETTGAGDTVLTYGDTQVTFFDAELTVADVAVAVNEPDLLLS